MAQDVKKVAVRKAEANLRDLSPIYLDNIETPVENAAVLKRQNCRKRIVFGWHNGRFNHLDWLLPLLPEAHHYCEPFAGSAAVLLNREPSPVETYNDIDGDVVNFFRVLRDRGDALARAVGLTPFSREEFHEAINGNTKRISDLERARRFYVQMRQACAWQAQTATLDGGANCEDISHAEMLSVVSHWLGGVNTLSEVATRLLQVQIENRPAAEVILRCDGPQTLFYCDPPYLEDATTCDFEMDLETHKELADIVNSVRGKVAISGYRCDQMDKWYSGWRRFDAEKKLRQECLWMNY
jgi:DNA adenine methylase